VGTSVGGMDEQPPTINGSATTRMVGLMFFSE
jgi:hypothetical protein